MNVSKQNLNIQPRSSCTSMSRASYRCYRCCRLKFCTVALSPFAAQLVYYPWSQCYVLVNESIHCTKKWIFTKFAQRKHNANIRPLQSKPAANVANATFAPYFHTCVNIVANAAFTTFATGPLQSKHMPALHLFCANLV